MSYKLRRCSECRGAMDPEEGCNGVCDECIQKKSEELARREALKNLFEPEMQIRFNQMRMEDFLNV